MREFRTSGSVGARRGNSPGYPTVVTNAPRDGLSSLEKDLESFRDIVLARGPLPTVLKQRLEGRLRRYLVRSLWDAQLLDGVPRRAPVQLRATDASSDEQRALATLALETALVRLSARGARTHSTAHRETLCSSYAAIREAARGGQRRATAFAASLTSLADVLPANRELPKFERVLEYLVDLARRREKAVVFCGRIATVHALRRALHDRLHAEIADERARWQRVRARLRRAEAKGAPLVAASSLPRLRLASHRRGKIPIGREASAVAHLDRELARSVPPGDAPELWDQAWGLRRRVDWVGVLAGAQEQDEQHRSARTVRFAFNLPGPPYILLCTEIAREGIDLHLWCRRIVQYDLDWNPALMEQQIGRVDRIGSLSRRTSRPVEVVWAWMPGSYEEFMANKVRERMEMMKVLLGAGEWLAASPEQQDAVAALAQYQLDFAP